MAGGGSYVVVVSPDVCAEKNGSIFQSQVQAHPGGLFKPLIYKRVIYLRGSINYQVIGWYPNGS